MRKHFQVLQKAPDECSQECWGDREERHQMIWLKDKRRLSGGRGSWWWHDIVSLLYWSLTCSGNFGAMLPGRNTGKNACMIPQDFGQPWRDTKLTPMVLYLYCQDTVWSLVVPCSFLKLLDHQTPAGLWLVLFSCWLFANNVLPINCGFQNLKPFDLL
jgi:hypothetical protein